MIDLTILVCVGAFLLLCGVLAVPAIRFIEYRPEFLIAAVFAVFVASAAVGGDEVLSFAVGGLRLYPFDLLCPVLLGLSLPFLFFRLKYGFSRNDAALLLLLGWAALLGWNYLYGIREFGLQTATNGFRAYFYVICIAIFTATLPSYRVWSVVEKATLFSAFILVAIALVGWSDGDLSRRGRPLASDEALILIQAFAVGAVAFSRGRLRAGFFLGCLIFLPVLLVLQHRSVWVVALAVLAMLYFYLPALRGVMNTALIVGGIAFSVLVFGFFGESIFLALTASYGEALSEDSTFVWRVLGWQSLLTGQHMDTVSEALTGNPFGSGWLRTFTGSDGVTVVTTEVMPHNYYVQTLLRSGAIGLVFLLLLYWRLLRATIRESRREGAGAVMAMALAMILVSQLLYYIPYRADPIQAVFIGCAIGMLRDGGRRRAEEP